MSKPTDEIKTQLEKGQQAKLTAFVQQPLQREAVNGLYTFTRLHNGVRQSNIYKNAHIMMPVAESTIFHPYHPTDVPAEYGGLAASIITMKCPEDMTESVFKRLPLSIQQIYGPTTLDIKKASIYVGTQNIPWGTEKTIPLLVRPQYWLFGSPDNDKAITSFVFNKTLKCRVGIFEPSNPKMTCSGAQNKLSPNLTDYTAHPDEPIKKPTMIICSPDVKDGAHVLTDIDYNQTVCLYSVVLDPTGCNEIKFHILLNKEDQERLANLSQSFDKTRSLQDIVNAISEWKDSELNAKGGSVDQLCKLFSIKVEPKAKVADKIHALEDDDMAQALAASLLASKPDKKHAQEDQDVDEQMKQALADSLHFAAQQEKAQKQAEKDLEDALKASQAAPVAHGFVAHKQTSSKEQDLKTMKDGFEVEKKKLADQLESLRRLQTQCNQVLDAKYSEKMAAAVISLPGILEDCKNLHEKIENNTTDAALLPKAIASYAVPSLEFIRKKVQAWDQKIQEYRHMLNNQGNKIGPQGTK